jgi:hypothetical protein
MRPRPKLRLVRALRVATLVAGSARHTSKPCGLLPLARPSQEKCRYWRLSIQKVPNTALFMSEMACLLLFRRLHFFLWFVRRMPYSALGRF